MRYKTSEEKMADVLFWFIICIAFTVAVGMIWFWVAVLFPWIGSLLS